MTGQNCSRLDAPSVEMRDDAMRHQVLEALGSGGDRLGNGFEAPRLRHLHAGDHVGTDASFAHDVHTIEKALHPEIVANVFLLAGSDDLKQAPVPDLEIGVV